MKSDNLKLISSAKASNAQAIEKIEELLARAKDGEVVELLYVEVNHMGETHVDWTETANVFERMGHMVHALIGVSLHARNML